MRLIDADELRERKSLLVEPRDKTVSMGKPVSDEEVYAYRLGWNDAIDAIMEYAPTVDHVKHGEWRYDEALKLEWCSECGFGKRKGDKRWYSYCPNCGAYMGVEE